MQQRARETRARVLRAAATVFEAKGFVQASISEILAIAGATKGAMYHHFPSKEYLARTLVEEQFAVKLVAPKVVGSALFHAIEITCSASLALRNDVEFQAAFALAIEQGGAGIFDRGDPFRQWIRVFTQLFDSAIDAHEISGDDFDSVTESHLIVGLVTGLQSMMRGLDDPELMDRAIRSYWTAFIDRTSGSTELAASRRQVLDGMFEPVRPHSTR